MAGQRRERVRTALCWVLALFYAFAGVMHLTRPEPFLGIMPEAVPWPEHVVFWTGVAELAGAAGLVQPWSAVVRRWAGIGLALYALCVWPANINHFALDMAKADGGLGLAYHVPRMMAQPLVIWLALWAGGATDWPLRRTP
ncbi:DoxX family protein [Altererythrobacter sp. H2]|uniref:DoxX family protein n=1 Tax=Altererythrobacter sp. H2 TaxID=3108391 RepID=UPI002B4BC463|nr:DoxX family protein [Altererythrobacter sp. H2]WRK96605.1 DoxX family protein [Altererythrobacter sp. H2]